MIYCIGNREHGICKIGFTTNVSKRIENLQVGSPFALTLFADMKGTQKQESALHVKFQLCRVRGEWFKLTQEIADHFGFDLNPKLTLWGIHATTVRKQNGYNFQMEEAEYLLAANEKEAVSMAKQRLNVLGYYLKIYARQIPIDVILEATATYDRDEYGADKPQAKLDATTIAHLDAMVAEHSAKQTKTL